jgi:acetyl-CoA carboxylase biotin carboxyl carrier protein
MERSVPAPLPTTVIRTDAPAEGVSPAPAADEADKITSPIVGVFYAAPAENAEPFVSIGDRVRKGQTLCIIEAMKLMNEITAEEDGVIEKICVTNGQVVEYGTELFRLRR